MRRRQFTHFIALLAGGTAATAFAGVPAAHRLLRIKAAPGEFSRDLFDTQIGLTFHMGERGLRTLLLKGVEDAACHSTCEQFSLVFELSSGSRLEEGIHRLEGPDGSRMDLYLFPSERKTAGQQLVSIFNLLPVV